MNVFISWSGKVSLQVALELREWLPLVLNELKPYVSSEDIDKGSRWGTEISKELEKSNFGIVCVTHGNDSEPWINFEAGALSKTVEDSRVAPFLFKVNRSEIKGPLLLFQPTIYEVEDVRKLVHSLYKACESPKLSKTKLNDSFNHWWPKLEEKLDQIHIECGRRELESKQLDLREALIQTSTVLRSNKAKSGEIQTTIVSIVKAWSQAVYKSDKPPVPTNVPPPAKGIRMACKLCDANHAPTKELCCTRCGIFCSEWLRADLVQED